MATFELTTGEKNPRGIPQARFIEDIDAFINNKAPTKELVDSRLGQLQELLNQFKFMEESKKVTLQNLKLKVPDIKQNIQIIESLKENKESKQYVNYQLNETLYTKAEIDENIENVFLWLGADVMLEYPIDEALEMLAQRLEIAVRSKETTIEDLEYLRENITTMEVNVARVYNWDVKRRMEEGAK